MNDISMVGLAPWLPWPLRRWAWWREPVRAERLAALRIGVALVLLVDVLVTYWPHLADYFGPDSLGAPIFREAGSPCRWSVLSQVESHETFRLAVAAWLLAIIMLLMGWWTRASAVAVWVLSMSLAILDPWIENAGDQVRGILLFYLMLSPCGATWSVDHWIDPSRRRNPGPRWIHPWPLRLIFIQMLVIYFFSGFYKLAGADWRSGNSLYEVLADPTLTRWSFAQWPAPFWLTRLLTWLVLGWELAFPLLVCWRKTRPAALWFGVAFHLGIAFSLELGGFVPYMLCLYLPLLPWERYVDRRRLRPPISSGKNEE